MSPASAISDHTKFRLLSSLALFLCICAFFCTSCSEKANTFQDSSLTDTGYQCFLGGEWGEDESELQKSFSKDQLSRMEEESHLRIVFEQPDNPVDQYIYITSIDKISFSDLPGSWTGQWILTPDGNLASSKITLQNAESDVFYSVLQTFNDKSTANKIDDEILRSTYQAYDPKDNGEVKLLWLADDGTYAYLIYMDNEYLGKVLTLETGDAEQMKQAIDLYSAQ